jgi:outer membrane protein
MLSKALIDQTLKNDIYRAYYSASAALEKFNATKTALDIAQKTYDYANKRFGVGLLSTYDLIISQSNLTNAQYNMASAQFDYVFKMKVLEFYKGQGIKL